MAPWIQQVINLGVQRLWVLDFEFEVDVGRSVPRRVVCMVATDVLSGEWIRLGPDRLGACPFRCDSSELFVAFYAIAEAFCFLELGWPLPPQWLDVWVEEVRLANGSIQKPGGLLSAMQRAGLPMRDTAHKQSMQSLIGEGRWSGADVPEILAYCEEDVADTSALLHARGAHYLTEAPGGLSDASVGQAVVRGRFAAENARMVATGLPIDVASHELIRRNAFAIRQRLVEDVEYQHRFGCYEGTIFKRDQFEHYVHSRGIEWPQLPSGALDLKDDTFKDMAERYPQIRPLHELRRALAVLKSNQFVIDSDGRARTNLRPFASKTGRSQPSSASYLFGLPKWMRSLLKPPPGYAIAYLDYASQEIAIAGALSGDERMLAGYRSGDPYIQFAKDARIVPQDATKDTHPDERRMCKAIVLGVNYGMGAKSLAARAGISRHESERLLSQHQRAYPRYWEWARRIQDRGAMGLPNYTPYGWRIQLSGGADLNLRSLGNWPVQSTGSDILRIATIEASNAGVPPIATVHDALVFEFPVEDTDVLVESARTAMIEAAAAVMGVEVRVDAEVFRYPDVYVDDAGRDFYARVLALASQCEADRGA